MGSSLLRLVMGRRSRCVRSKALFLIFNLVMVITKTTTTIDIICIIGFCSNPVVLGDDTDHTITHTTVLRKNKLQGGESVNDVDATPYGAEVSWPMQTSITAVDDSMDDNNVINDDKTESLLSRKYSNYMDYMKGCYDHYSSIQICQHHERIRIHQNHNQPKQVHKNFTALGYSSSGGSGRSTKQRQQSLMAPTMTFQLLRDYWDRYSSTHLQYEPQPGSIGHYDDAAININIYNNHWTSPTKVLYLNPPPEYLYPTSSSSSPPQMSVQHQRTMIQQVQTVVEEFTGGVPVQFRSLYGIRSYTNHTIVVPHVDRIPMVITAVINVAQQHRGSVNTGTGDDNWILELIGHDGYAVNVTLEPGEMIIYEGHSIIHGRPYPFHGQYYANCYFHFEPIGYTSEYHYNTVKQERGGDASSPDRRTIKTTREKYEAAFAKVLVKQQQSTSLISTDSITSNSNSNSPEMLKTKNLLPHSISEGTIEAQRWRQEFDFRRVTLRHDNDEYDNSNNGDIDTDLFPKLMQRNINSSPKQTIGATSAHVLAAKNDVARLRDIAQTDPKSLDVADVNGWLPLHEAARGGCTEVIKFLLEEWGQVHNINARTNDGRGGTALWWAEHGLPPGHEVIIILKRNGAASIAPFQKKKTKNNRDHITATISGKSSKTDADTIDEEEIKEDAEREDEIKEDAQGEEEIKEDAEEEEIKEDAEKEEIKEVEE